MPKPRSQRAAKTVPARPPASRPPRPAPVLEVRVADVDVDGQVRVLPTAPQAVRARPGQRVRLVCTYRFKTASSHTESLTVRLGTAGTRGAARVDEAQLAASAEGTLDCTLGGTGEVHWSVDVDFEVRHWGGGQLLHAEREHVEGKLRFEV